MTARSESAKPEAGAAPDYLESLPFATMAFDFDLVILGLNRRHEAMTGIGREQLLGRGLFEAFPPNPDDPDTTDEAAVRLSVERVRETGETDAMPVVRYDIERPSEPGTFDTRYWEIMHSPLVQGEAMVGVLQTSRDITAQRSQLDLEVARQRAAESAGNMQFWEVDPQSGASTRTAALDAMFGFGPDEVGDDIAKLVERIHPDDRAGAWTDLVAARTAPIGTVFNRDYRVMLPNGGVRHINSTSEILSVPDEGRRMTGVLTDTTASHNREESLRRLLAEKQKLLADVNHRVKNSLQLVSSILRMEERYVARQGEGETLAAERLGVAAARVATIAAVHASLYHHADVSWVNMSDHLRTFCGQLEDAEGVPVRLRLDEEPVFLPAEKAVPLGLIVNELATEVAEATGGPLEVALHVHGPGLLLHVGEEGTSDGRPGASRAARVASEGDSGQQGTGAAPQGNGGVRPRLVEALVAQLGGKLENADDIARSVTFDPA